MTYLLKYAFIWKVFFKIIIKFTLDEYHSFMNVKVFRIHKAMRNGMNGH